MASNQTLTGDPHLYHMHFNSKDFPLPPGELAEMIGWRDRTGQHRTIYAYSPRDATRKRSSETNHCETMQQNDVDKGVALQNDNNTSLEKTRNATTGRQRK